MGGLIVDMARVIIFGAIISNFQEMFPQNCSIFVPYHGALFIVFFEI